MAKTRPHVEPYLSDYEFLKQCERLDHGCAVVRERQRAHRAKKANLVVEGFDRVSEKDRVISIDTASVESARQRALQGGIVSIVVEYADKSVAKTAAAIRAGDRFTIDKATSSLMGDIYAALNQSGAPIRLKVEPHASLGVGYSAQDDPSQLHRNLLCIPASPWPVYARPGTLFGIEMEGKAI